MNIDTISIVYKYLFRIEDKTKILFLTCNIYNNLWKYVKLKKRTRLLLHNIDLKLKTKYMHNKFSTNYSLYVLSLLNVGIFDIPIFPKIQKGYIQYVPINKLLKNVIYKQKRKICNEIGEFIDDKLLKTSNIYGKCGKYIPDTDYIDKKKYKDYLQISYCGMPGDYNCREIRCAIIPYTSCIGIRFNFKGETQYHLLTKYFKSLPSLKARF